LRDIGLSEFLRRANDGREPFRCCSPLASVPRTQLDLEVLFTVRNRF
jgi:hypothetical protein